jgi:hypothetical protein
LKKLASQIERQLQSGDWIHCAYLRVGIATLLAARPERSRGKDRAVREGIWL